MLPTQLTSHWWQRPGRRPGREQYHWHILFHDQPAVAALAATAQRKLAALSCLDQVPERWLHLTTLVVGFADETDQAAVEAMVREARTLLAVVRPVQVSLGRVFYHPEAVVLAVEPLGALDPVLDAVTAACAAAGLDGQPDTRPWLPHISVAYANTSAPAAPVIAALGRWLPGTQITVHSVSLVAQTQVGRSWQWRPVAEVPLAGS